MNPSANALSLLADIDHPVTRAKARELYNPEYGAIENFKHIFYFVRDEINFGFPKVWDTVTASETIRSGIGYCNTKAILMQALCTLNHIPIKLKAGQIRTEIMKGIFPVWSFPFLDETASHMWVEVELDHHAYEVDAYILDHEFYVGAKDLMLNHNWTFGYALGEIDIHKNGDWDEGFVQTNMVNHRSGTWSDAAEFYASASYNELNFFQKLGMPMLRNAANKTIEIIRQHGSNMINTEGVIPNLELAM